MSGASALMWSDYFENANIYTLDRDHPSDNSRWPDFFPPVNMDFVEKIENSSSAVLNEHPLINSKFEIITNKIFKNLSSPKLLLNNFDKKIFNFYLLIKDLILRKKRNLKNNNKHAYNKKSFISKLDILKKNSELIKEFYREDNLKFMNDLNIDIKKHDYF